MKINAMKFVKVDNTQKMVLAIRAQILETAQFATMLNVNCNVIFLNSLKMEVVNHALM